MFGVRGRSWIALGAPVGRRDERLELLWRFRELADAHAARPGFYGLGPEDLPDVVELGFSIQKMGESAVVPLDGFSIEGRRRGNLRRAWRRAGEDGRDLRGRAAARDSAPLMPELQAISDAVAGRPRRRREGLLAWAASARAMWPSSRWRWCAQGGRIVAFATLWTTAAGASSPWT